ncbi:MAG: acyltransferase, partial [Rhodoglobus sp.]
MSGDRAEQPRRPDIQGLRAVAVGLVIGYHFSPALVPAGFVGVDVFFVISGYLITGLLVGEIARSGRISLLSFYSRRVRRILPAALTVTLATLIVAYFVYPRLGFLEVARDAAWATAYLANVHLAQDPVGYFATAAPSAFTHFWSLAVEEQFYLVWPVLLLIVVLLAKKSWRRWSLIVIGSVLVVSMALSVILTNVAPTLAFYSLSTRAWELAIGAGLAVAAQVLTKIPPRWSTEVAGALGVAAILTSAIVFSEFTPVPGSAAILPTIGAALILWSGAQSRTVVGRALSLWPARRVGDISYSLYLWHWPVLIFGFPNIDASPILRLGLLALVFALAIASYLLIERPANRIRIRP